MEGVPDDELDLPLILSSTEDERLARMNSVTVDALEFLCPLRVLDFDLQEKFYDTGMLEPIPDDDVGNRTLTISPMC